VLSGMAGPVDDANRSLPREDFPDDWPERLARENARIKAAAEKRAIRRALAHLRRAREESSGRKKPEEPPKRDGEP
jgi:hypothetical protein